MRFIRDLFEVVRVPTAWSEDGVPTAWDEERLHVNISRGFTGDPRLPYYVDGTALVLPDGTPGPDLAAFVVSPEPGTPLAVFLGVETLFLRDGDEGGLAEALSAYVVEAEGDDE